MSYPMALFEFETDDLHQGGKTDKSLSTSVQTKDEDNNLTWAQRVHRSQRSLSTSTTDTQSITQSTVPEDDYLSDLASSRAEVEELKRRVQHYEKMNEQQQKDFERQTEHQRREMELHLSEKTMELERNAEIHRREIEQQAIQQKREMERQVDDQRREMENQLQLQRQEFERRVETQRKEMETHIARHVQEALSDNRRQQQSPVPPSNAEHEFREFMMNNNRHMQMLTEMVMQMMNATSSIPVTNTRNDHVQGVGAKRAEESSEEDGDDDGDYTQDTRVHSTTTVMARKRRNTRTSPQKMSASSGRMFHEGFSDPQFSPPAFDTRATHREEEVFPVINRNTSTPLSILIVQTPRVPYIQTTQTILSMIAIRNCR
ncbi:hypothetical protein MHU86_8045 [Fragilaria crotonensis]|nr:hypothetical protein MHU86_8045 [Fragilaria crotonensis]